MKKIIFTFIISLIGFSCKKEEKKPINNPNSTELITEKNWILKEYNVEPPIFGLTDLYKDLNDCEKDNIHKYLKNGILMIDKGPKNCFQDEAKIDSSSLWQIKDEFLIHKVLVNSKYVDDTLFNLKVNEQNLSFESKQKILNITHIYSYKYSIIK